jgi:hypothetical protein
MYYESKESAKKRALAREIRDRYLSRRTLFEAAVGNGGSFNKTRHYPIWDGGDDSRNVVRSPVWPGLADYALKHKIDVPVWVEALFDLAHVFDHVPQPADLKDPRILERVGEWKEVQENDARFGTRTELLTMVKERHLRKLTTDQPQADIDRALVVDPTVDVTALVRYVFAVRAGHQDLAERFLPQARAQFSRFPAVYKEVLGSPLPSTLVG